MNAETIQSDRRWLKSRSRANSQVKFDAEVNVSIVACIYILTTPSLLAYPMASSEPPGSLETMQSEQSLGKKG